MSINRAKEVLKIEYKAVKDLIHRLDKKFETAVDMLAACSGHIVLTGMGKSGFIAQKISATLASMGSPSLWMHPAEAIHGDLGRVTTDDIIIALSNSGQTEEIVRLLPTIKKIGAQLISFCGVAASDLAKNSDVFLDIGVKEEACPLGLAPTASTTAMLAMGDALAMAVAEKKGFKESDYALFHPGGSLGRRLLLTVKEIMRTGEANAVMDAKTLVRDVLLKITKARAGCAVIVNDKGRVEGIFTDGDLRRHLETDVKLTTRPVGEAMTADPIVVSEDKLACEALKLMRDKKIDEVPVVDEQGLFAGLLDVQDLLKAGLV